MQVSLIRWHMAEATVHVQARMGSSRLPGKVLLPLGERRLVGWMVERAERSGVDDVVVATGDRPANDAITAWCDRHGVNSYVGPESDLLTRHLGAAEAFNSDPVVRVTADCPLLPVSEIDRMLALYRSADADYVSNMTDAMPVGIAVDVISRAMLADLQSIGATHPTRMLRAEEGPWECIISPQERYLPFADVRITVDTPADYWSLTDAVASVGTDPEAVMEHLKHRDVDVHL